MSVKVLLVDDAEAARMTFAALLEDAGYQVTEAASLAQARRCLDAARPTLAILDLQLTDGRGTELLPALQQAGALVLMLSGSNPEPIDGVADFLTKSEAPAELLARIGAALQRWEQR